MDITKEKIRRESVNRTEDIQGPAPVLESLATIQCYSAYLGDLAH